MKRQVTLSVSVKVTGEQEGGGDFDFVMLAISLLQGTIPSRVLRNGRMYGVDVLGFALIDNPPLKGGG